MELLTKLEELVLIAILRLKDKAYGISVCRSDRKRSFSQQRLFSSRETCQEGLMTPKSC